ncbi:sulfotransferase [Planctomycetota bacterium]
MTLPTFLVIGMPKCGTTSLHFYLMQHPQVFMSRVKEPHFFLFDGVEGRPSRFADRNRITDIHAYEGLFSRRKGELAVGEVSPGYASCPGTHVSIRRRLPNAKLVAILRQPADRAYSNMMRRKANGREPRGSVEEAFWSSEESEADTSWFAWYQSIGFYYERLEPYFASFPREQLKVLLFDDLQADPRALMKDLFRFIGVDDGFEPDLSVRYNQAGVIANPVLRVLWRHTYGLRTLLTPYIPIRYRGHLTESMRRWRQKPLKCEPLLPETRAKITELYREDILKLQDLIGRDLSMWLST